MASYNRVILVGNLTRDPEVRYTASSRAVAQLSLAVNETFKTADGEKKERTDYFDIDVWGPQGENCGKYLPKGRSVPVEGRLRQETWENEQNEKKEAKAVKVTSRAADDLIGNFNASIEELKRINEMENFIDLL